MSTPVSIILIEDDRNLGRSLADGLTEAGFDVSWHQGIGGLRTEIEERKPNLVLLDLGLPDGDGIKLLRSLSTAPVRPAVIVITARDRLQDKLSALGDGADDYLVKPFDFLELVARIRVQIRHQNMAPPQPTDLVIGPLTLSLLTREVFRDGEPVQLSPREFELLACLAKAEGKIVSREQIAMDVWNTDRNYTGINNLIDVHISKLREKLDKGHKEKLIQTIRGAGFALRRGQ
jgi:two-component system copper resistance phosphate regulon response regulator CusR